MKILKGFSALIMLIAFTACSSDDRDKLYVLNWGEYIDYTLVEQFEEEFNVQVIYEEVESTEAMYSKISAEAVSYDVAFPSEYTIELMIKEDMLHELDKDIITNFVNVDSKYYDLTDFDVSGQYYVPYFTGSIGIMYNTDLVDSSDLTGWDILWNDKYDNQVYMYDSIRDAMSVGAFYSRYSINTTNDEELDAIESSLSELNGKLRGYGTDDLKNLIVAGDGAMAVVYSGDFLVTYEDHMSNDLDLNVDYFIPEEGTNVWLDGVVIPKTSQNTDLANEFINFMLDDANAKTNAEYVGYTTTNEKAYNEFLELGEELYTTEAYRVPEEKMSQSEVYKDLGIEYNQIYSEIFIRVKNN